MSFGTGLIAGLLIAGSEVALEHYGPSFGPFSLRGNGALAALVILVPLALFWGWTWIGNRWSGRSDLPILLYTFGLYLGVGFAAPLNALFFPPAGTSATDALVNSVPSLLLTGLIFVLPPAVIGGLIYALFKSGRLPTNFITLTIGYLIGIPLAFLIPQLPLPVVSMGTVAGTAAGHAWRSGGRLLIAIWVILLMALMMFGIPYLLSTGFQLPAVPLP
jgi:hypothetical protein